MIEKMDERLRKQLDFVLEVDKEKNIFRQTHLSGHGRNENDAEHAWHMALMAYLLKEYANESVDITKDQVYGRQSKTRLGSEKLYEEVTDKLILEHIQKGNIKS